ncbi:MAG: hypothetical protein LBT00_09495 [Spirochaetaceae bacterium]|nr:hypothetical protein [Spirochaetaceae bacterium]
MLVRAVRGSIVIASRVVTSSLRGAKRRSNPDGEGPHTRLLRAAPSQ